MACPGGTYAIRIFGSEACFPYLQVLPKWPPKPDPVDRVRWSEDLAILATINEMVSVGLSEKMQAPMQQAIRSVSQELQKQLPEGVGFKLNGQEEFTSACKSEQQYAK